MRRNFKKMYTYGKRLGRNIGNIASRTLSAVGDIQGAVEKFKDGSAINIVSGCLDIAGVVANFLPPPVSTIAGPVIGLVNGIMGMFGGGGPSTTDVINEGFAKQKETRKNTDF